MASHITVTRNAPRPKTTRGALKAGVVFTGKPGGKQYINIGSNGKYLAVNIQNGKLVTTKKGNKSVTVVGNAKLATKMSVVPMEVARSQVKPGQLFKARQDGKVMAHVARFNDGRYVSLDAASPFAGDYISAPANKGDKRVQVVGTYSFTAEVLSA